MWSDEFAKKLGLHRSQSGFVRNGRWVVTATMLQFRSNWAASAGGAKLMIAKAVDSAKAQIRLPIMGVLMRVLRSHNVIGGHNDQVNRFRACLGASGVSAGSTP